MFSKDNRAPPNQSTAQHRLKERRVLVRVQDLSAFAIGEGLQTFCASAINSWLSMKMFDNESIPLQAVADFSDFIENRDDAMKLITESANHLINQNFGPTNAQRMNDMADRRSIVDGGNAKMFR